MPPAEAASRPTQMRPFEARDLDAAAGLLAARHCRHRLAEPLLDPAYEARGAARHELEPPPASFGVLPKAELVIRRAKRADLPALAELDLVLPRHGRLAPVFSRRPVQPVEEVLDELERGFDDPRFTTFVAEADGDSQ